MAVKYFQMAADQGHVGAQYNMGASYYIGQGVEKDFKMAVKYFQMAADQGNTVAQHNLGVCYLNGEGVKKDPKIAAEYFQMSGDSGNADAKIQLNAHGENKNILFPQPKKVQKNKSGQDNLQHAPKKENCLLM
jgi:hypothetical protein